MHPFPESCCCISLVQSPQQGAQIQPVVVLQMAGMGAASKEVWGLGMSWVGALQSIQFNALCHGSAGNGALNLPPT